MSESTTSTNPINPGSPAEEPHPPDPPPTLPAQPEPPLPEMEEEVVVRGEEGDDPPSPQMHKLQDVRVDNWGNYCLQRLQHMYERGDFCDLTLQFHTNQLLKVHRVVLNVCTEYFANLERLFGLTDGVLVLPKDVEYQAMVTIVKFFYTGKLEMRANLFNEVYKTVRLMNITILVKLLEAHSKKPLLQVKKEFVPNRSPGSMKQGGEGGRQVAKGQVSPGGGMQLSGTQMKYGGATTLAIQGAGGTKTLQVTTPGMKLPPGVKTKTVLARVQPQGMRLGQGGLSKVMGQKKLPIWKERKFNPRDSATSEKWAVKDEPPRPTRFEWGDPDEDPFSISPAQVFNSNLLEKPKATPSPTPTPAGMRKIEDIFDAVKSQTLGKRSNAGAASADQPLVKVGKMSPSADLGEDFTDSGAQGENDDVNLTEDTVEEEVSTTEEAPPVAVKSTTPILKPALKPQLTRMTPMVSQNDPNLGETVKSPAGPTASGSRTQLSHAKTVRFAPEIEKENSKDTEVHTAEISTEEDVASNHSKIIAEVLKKYPDLVKDKQNIKLKIVQKGSDASSKDKSKVSYIVLKSTSAPESMGAVLLKKPNTTINKNFWEGQDAKEKKPSGAENTTGPWLCGPCGGGEETPMEFESYYVYRRHLVEVHGERIDARICEYCGQKASKRNLLLYHLYTKHGVAPPKNMHFPNCDRCDYIALSESLLSKHKLTHDATKEFSCQICNASFKSSGALQGHMAANLHRNKDTKVYECPYCRKPFVRNINLKGHIRALHRDIARMEEMEDPRLPHDETLAIRSNSNASPNRKRQFPAILGSRTVPLEILPSDGTPGQQVSLVTADGHTIEILHGLDPNAMQVPMTLVPSSEAEAMTSVANSIAASLGLDQGVHGGQEYITGVPSADGSQVYIMDSSQPAVEVDMSSMSLAPDGTMIYEGDDPNSQGQFIVQDIHGNQFRKMTGIDETGKQVIFFQLSGDHHGQMAIAPTILEEGIQVSNDNSSVFVSSDMTVPVNVTSDSSNQQQAQVILTTSGHEGAMFDIVPVPTTQEQGEVLLAPLPTSAPQTTESNQHVYHNSEVDSNVQQLHIVLGENSDNNASEHVQQGESMLSEGHEHEHVYQHDADDSNTVERDPEVKFTPHKSPDANQTDIKEKDEDGDALVDSEDTDTAEHIEGEIAAENPSCKVESVNEQETQVIEMTPAENSEEHEEMELVEEEVVQEGN